MKHCGDSREGLCTSGVTVLDMVLQGRLEQREFGWRGKSFGSDFLVEFPREGRIPESFRGIQYRHIVSPGFEWSWWKERGWLSFLPALQNRNHSKDG